MGKEKDLKQIVGRDGENIITLEKMSLNTMDHPGPFLVCGVAENMKETKKGECIHHGASVEKS